MNQEKIGKLIAKQRKAKGLTQQQLGDKVGVGYRAVSKWETGLTLPDISIINELSAILGITADELLKGELNNKEQKHHSKTALLIIIFTIMIITIIVSIYIKNSNSEYAYTITVDNANTHVVGNTVFKRNRLKMTIKSINFDDYELNQTMVQNYQYKIISNDVVIFGFGYNSITESLKEPVMIRDLLKKINIDFYDEIELTQNEIVENNIFVEFIFTDIDGNIINKELELVLIPIKKESQPDK